MKYPNAYDPSKVGTYELKSLSGGGLMYDEVLEYRVWVHPPREDVYCVSFGNYRDAKSFSLKNKCAEKPLALVLQKEYFEENENGVLELIKKQRITEWIVEWLNKSKRTRKKINEIFSNKNYKIYN